MKNKNYILNNSFQEQSSTEDSVDEFLEGMEENFNNLVNRFGEDVYPSNSDSKKH